MAPEVGRAGRLAKALRSFRAKNGHFPGCRHGQWVDGYSLGRYLDGSGWGHPPCLPNCDGDGAPCSKRCADARAALEHLEPT